MWIPRKLLVNSSGCKRRFGQVLPFGPDGWREEATKRLRLAIWAAYRRAGHEVD